MLLTPSWHAAATPPPLAPATIHVWQVRLAPTPAHSTTLLALLTEAEQARAHRYLVEAARQQFVVMRGMLRLLLAAYLHCAPHELTFQFGAHGKPALATAPPLHFNVAHSQDIGLIAFCRTAPVGVDVEQERSEVAVLDLAQRYFAPTEAAALRTLPPDQQQSGFFACWTHKEACLKATGSTLVAGLQQFVLRVQPPHPPRLLATPPDQPPPTTWTLASLPLVPGYHAAVASPSENLLIQCLERNLDSIL